MCGLVGIAGDIGYTEEGLFKDLLVMDTVRGYHSTGMAVIDSDRTPEGSTVFKLPVSGPDFVKHEMFSKSIPYTSSVLIGHNRAATVGAVNSHNAHPFANDSIIGAHNGTLPFLARKNLDDYRDYTTDSEALLWNIHKCGVELTLGSIWGAWALTYWDFDADRLCMVRNNERPLCYAYSKDRRTVMWASEYEMLYAASSRNHIETEVAQIVPIDTVLEFDIPSYLAKDAKLKDPEEVATVMPGKPPAPLVDTTGKIIAMGDKRKKKGSTQTSLTTTTGTTGDLTGDEDTSICDACFDVANPRDHHTVTVGWGEDMVLCQACVDDPDVQRMMYN